MGKTPKSPKTQLHQCILLMGYHKSAENSDDESGIEIETKKSKSKVVMIILSIAIIIALIVL